MDAPLYFFKVFTDELKSGNPAAAVLLNSWPETDVLQQIASNARQVVTAFVVPVVHQPYQYQIRWFSCVQEINLCGHGTLAAAALVRQLKGDGSYLFVSPYGELEVDACQQSLQMALPVWPATCTELPAAFTDLQPVDYFQTRDLVLVLADEQAVKQFQPDFALIRQLSQHALIVTAFSPPASYVLRYFAPGIGINEDIATGSAQCSLAPYWADKTGLRAFKVRQLSDTAACFSVSMDTQQLQLQTQVVHVAQP